MQLFATVYFALSPIICYILVVLKLQNVSIMLHVKIKRFILLLGLFVPTAWCCAHTSLLFDGYSHITVKEKVVQGAPKGSSIQASIYGHTLMVTFTENLGQVAVKIATAAGVTVDCSSTATPNGLQFYIPLAGDYIVTFTLPNGDEYYGEFTVTD